MLTFRCRARASCATSPSRPQCARRKPQCSISAAATTASSSTTAGSAQAQRSSSAKPASSSSTALSIIPWAISNGIQFAKIKPAVFGSSQDRGVVATFDIGSNECICSVPAKAALRTYPGCSPALGVPADVWQQLPWYAQLALVLLSEVKQGQASKFSDYLALLPEQVEVPALWTEEELQQLRCPYFIQQVVQQRAEWSGLAQRLQPFLASAGLSQQQLLWALSITRSRAFAAPYAAAPLSTAPKALAAAQVLAAAAWLAAGTAAAVGVELLGAAAGAGAWYALQQQLQTQQQHAICPLLDFFNHDGREQSECELDVWSNSFRVVSMRQWRQGQQVAISYGRSSSDVLLQLYGFVEPGNVHERYLVRSLPCVLEQQGLLATAEASAALAEVAFTRQGIPAAAAAALEQVCKQPWRSVDSADLMSYAALSGTARAACAAAVQQELQRLGAHQQTLADDLAVLQAVQELPVKQQEMEALQGLLQTTQAELHRLQAQMEQQQQQQQQDEAAQRQAMSGNGVAPEVKPGSDGMEGAGEGQQTALQGEVADATARVQDLHQQVSSLQQLLGEWTQLVSGQKLLAVQFRLEKQQLLDGLVAQLA